MKKKNSGFTLVEVVVVTFILAFVFVYMVQFFIYASQQASIAGNMTTAVSVAQDKIEEIRNHSYGSIATDYAAGGTPGNIFPINEINGVGTVFVDPSNAELLDVTVSIFWQDKYGRLMGEDTNLDGVFDIGAGEDLNNDGIQSSPVRLMTKITRR